jgi:hypothetical protein
MSSQHVASLQSEVQALEYGGGEQITISDYLLTRLEQLGVRVSLHRIVARATISTLLSHSAYVRRAW